MLEEGLQKQSEVQSLVSAQVSVAMEEEAFSSLSSFSFASLSPGTPEELAVAGTPSPSLSLQGEYSSPTAIAATPLSISYEGSSSQEEQGPSTTQALPDTKHLPRDRLDEKMTDLVQFLLLKYQTKEPFTKAEMLNTILSSKSTRTTSL
ncbi:melanoma-associated antigen 10-like [Dugong dugon]